MLAKVEIENKDGLVLIKYKNPKYALYNDTPTFSLLEKKNSLLYKGYFLLSDDQHIAENVLRSLIRDLSIENESFILKKHAIVYCYIDNYLTTRNPAFSIPRKRREPEIHQLNVLGKKKVYVEVADKVFQRSTQGQSITTSYGHITTRPTDDVGSMSLKIDSRSLCGMKNIQFDPLVCTAREGITTLLTCPSRDSTIMTYTFQCNEADLPMVKIVLIDSRTIEILLCFDLGLAPESFKASLTFDFNVGNISIECKKGKHEYIPGSRTLTWIVTPTENISLTVRTSEPHKSSATLKYKYFFSKTAISSVLVNSLSSEADENWIKYTTFVSGLLRALE